MTLERLISETVVESNSNETLFVVSTKILVVFYCIIGFNKNNCLYTFIYIKATALLF